MDRLNAYYGSAVGINDLGDVVGWAVAPEPSTWAMMLLGFAGLGFVGYRRARAGNTTPPAYTAQPRSSDP
jgi:hypothetical protein